MKRSETHNLFLLLARMLLIHRNVWYQQQFSDNIIHSAMTQLWLFTALTGLAPYVGSSFANFPPNFSFLFGVTITMESGDRRGGAGEPSLTWRALMPPEPSPELSSLALNYKIYAKQNLHSSIFHYTLYRLHSSRQTRAIYGNKNIDERWYEDTVRKWNNMSYMLS